MHKSEIRTHYNTHIGICEHYLEYISTAYIERIDLELCSSYYIHKYRCALILLPSDRSPLAVGSE